MATAVWSGYFSAYFTNSKHPKPPGYHIKKIYSRKKHSGKGDKPDTDMFQQQMQNFKARGGDLGWLNKVTIPLTSTSPGTPRA